MTALGLMAGLGWTVASRRTTRRPLNVLLVVWDTVRADRLSVYGHSRNTTPWLERFAADAVVFEQAISPGVWTVPGHGSLFTGLPVSSHGAGEGWTWLDQRFDTLAELLGGAGYETWAWSTNPYLSPATNLLQGFDTVELAWDGAWAEEVAQANSEKLIARDRSTELSPSWQPNGRGQGWPRHLATHKDAGTVIQTALLDWLDHREEPRPFFVYLNYMEAHHPRVPSMRARTQVLGDDPALLERGLAMDASMFRTMAAMEGHEPFSEDELEAIRGVYDASLADLDRATGDLMDALQARGVLDDTVVILVADHGEHLGEQGMFDHRWSVRQPLIHVPLVVHHPDLAPARIAEPVSTSDLFATVCDLAGVELPRVSQGRSLLGARSGGPPVAELGEPARRLAVVRRALGDLDPDRWSQRYTVVVDGDDKLVRDDSGPVGLFDLAADPGELHDRGHEVDPERLRLLDAAITAWLGRFPPYDPSLRAAGDEPGAALKAPGRVRDQLRALGYADDP